MKLPEKAFNSRLAPLLRAAPIPIPGDKSISHRALMLGAIAEGITEVVGFLQGEDCRATLHALKAMGVHIEEKGDSLKIHGVGLRGLSQPKQVIDCGNSGTSMRLLCGILAGQSFESVLTGDSSLSQRPMNRVIEPLSLMGAKINAKSGGFSPITIQGGNPLEGICYTLPMGSAQVKSCLLLAGLYAKGITTVIETNITRDHTERLLQAFHVKCERQGSRISIQGGQTLKATSIFIPGDISSAAFFIVAATIIPGSKIRLNNIGINPTRTGCITILKQMGANIQMENIREMSGEPVADILVESARLRGITLSENLVPLAIDEFPILFIAAAVAHGTTTLKGAKELRVKESDRIHTMAVGLKQLGILCEEQPEGITITGGKFSGGEVDACHDHRVAMAFHIAGCVAQGKVQVKSSENIKTSFPGFEKLLKGE